MGSDSRRILIGKITGAHGIKGEVKVLSQAADAGLLFRPEGVYTAESGTTRLKLSARAEPKPDFFIARIEGVSDRNHSETLRGTRLYIERDELPELDDDVYLSDLEGAEVRLPDGTVLGRVVAIQNFGASDLIDVLGADGKSQYYPLAEPFVTEMNAEAGYIIIDPPEVMA